MQTTIANLKELNKKAGYHFFDRDTMRFFRSKIEMSATTKQGYFITSEQFNEDAPRYYTIRQAKDEDAKNILTIGEFQEYKTYKEAMAKIKELEF